MKDQQFDTIENQYKKKLDYKSAWGNIQAKISSRTNRTRRMKLLFAVVFISICIFFGSIVISLPIISDATTPLMKGIVDTKNKIFSGVTNPPPINDGNTSAFPGIVLHTSGNRENLNVNIKKRRTTWKNYHEFIHAIDNFPLPVIKHLPKDYFFFRGNSYTSDQQIFYTRQLFKTKSNNSFLIESKQLSTFQNPELEIENEDYTMESITLKNDMLVYIFVYYGEQIEIIHYSDNAEHKLSSKDLSMEEAIHIMESIEF